MKKTFLFTLITAIFLLFSSVGCKKDIIDTGGVNAKENLTIKTVMGPKKTGCGGFDWTVTFTLKNASAKGGWVIQKYTRTPSIFSCPGVLLDGPGLTYWEAWRIAPGTDGDSLRLAGDFNFDDEFLEPDHPNTFGDINISGEVKFFEGLNLPADFIPNNPKTYAHDLPSTTTKPAFWDATNAAPHIFATDWNCCKSPGTGSYHSIPDGGGLGNVPKKIDSSKLDNTGRQILNIPAWTTDYSTTQNQALLNIARQVSNGTSSAALHNSLVKFQAAVAGTDDYIGQESKLYLLLRVLFQLPQSTSTNNVKVYGGWIHPSINQNQTDFNLTWPVSVSQSQTGYQVNVERFKGFTGRGYNAVAEFDYFNANYPKRNL